MSLPVLERVERPRRRPRRRWARPVAALALAAALGGGAYCTVYFWPHATEGAAAKAPQAPRTPVAKRAPGPLLTSFGRTRHRFDPPLTAHTAVLVDASTGSVLWALRPHLRRPIASTTKIMTAYLALQRLRPRAVVTVDRSVPRVADFREGLRAGERVPAWKLFYGLLLYSGNDDALALAIAAGGSRPAFVSLMNDEARRLRLRNTHFSSPSGVVDRDNYSSAWDLAALTRVALENGRFRQIVRTRIKRVPWPAPTFSKVYVNKNHLLATYRGADGVKTGWTTKAGHCLVASAQRGRRRLIAVLLGAPDAYRDARRLLNYGFRLG